MKKLLLPRVQTALMRKFPHGATYARGENPVGLSEGDWIREFSVIVTTRNVHHMNREFKY